MRHIDLNADVGEGFGATDAALVPLLSSANIACGGHAGDAGTMAACVALCQAHGVAIGAHPSDPDREGFGRRDVAIDAQDLRASLSAQIRALAEVAHASGARLTHVKPHGALYNRAAVDPVLAALVADVVRQVDPSLLLMGLAGSCVPVAGRAAGLGVLAEGFADRRYTEHGFLLPRNAVSAVIEDSGEVREQLLSMVLEGCVVSACGSTVHIEPDTVCLHGDGPHAVAFARLVRKVLGEAGVGIRAVKA
jgi:UPF0271 protein